MSKTGPTRNDRQEGEAPDDPRVSELFDDLLPLSVAAQRSGLAAHTLTQQAEKGKLKARKIGRAWVTTAQWLREYLATYSRRARRAGRSRQSSTVERTAAPPVASSEAVGL